MAPQSQSSPDPDVDLVVVFRAGTSSDRRFLSKQEAHAAAAAAEAEYLKLLETLRNVGGMRVSGKRGQKNGQILVFVWAPPNRLSKLLQRERYTDFLRGLPVAELLTQQADSHDPSSFIDPSILSPSERLRLVYEFITSTPRDGGLGIVPGSENWSRVEGIFALHDHDFNDLWMRSWTRRQIGFGLSNTALDRLRERFGEAVALYFAFLSSYTRSLIYCAALGVSFYILHMPYNAIYSTLLVLWSISFVEVWSIRERELSIRWGSRGSFRVERRRAQYKDLDSNGLKFSWWRRDLRIFASLPIILLFAAILAALLTGIFIVEAFVTQLYTGPGALFVSFTPTLLFAALVPQVLRVYQSYARKLTNWENHAHQSTHEASLTLKTFTLSAIVAYLGLFLSAFVYMPFGEQLMVAVSRTLFLTSAVVGEHASRAADYINTTTAVKSDSMAEDTVLGRKIDLNVWANGAKTDPARLQNQMFAYTVTQSAVNTFNEVGLPYVMRKIEEYRSGTSGASKPKSRLSSPSSPSKSIVSGSSSPDQKKSSWVNGKRVVFEDEDYAGRSEREFLARVRHEAALPDYTLFEDYSEMVTQFGYVSLWSTIWPLAPVMALINNWLEMRSDAFKIATHFRRPIPIRTDSIGPWLDTLSFLAWLSALTNGALVYLFRPEHFSPPNSDESMVNSTTSSDFSASSDPTQIFHIDMNTARVALLLPTLVVALCSSHAYRLARLIVQHILERALWKGSEMANREEEAERAVKGWYLRSLGIEDVEAETKRLGEVTPISRTASEETRNSPGDSIGFWDRDEGLNEIRKALKDA